jgi:broad specificity phosphatase PhoE
MTTSAIANAQACAGARAVTVRQIVLLRHAEADQKGRFCGHSDPSLSFQGRSMLRAIVQGLVHMAISPSSIWCSDLRRAQETAAPIANHYGLSCTLSSRLREMNFGAWEGLSWSEVERQYPDDARAWVERFPQHRPPGGESFLELRTRVVNELEALAKISRNGTTLVVTHAGFIRTAVAWVLGVEDQRISRISLSYGGLSTLDNIRGSWCVAGVNLDLSRFVSINKDGDR